MTPERAPGPARGGEREDEALYVGRGRLALRAGDLEKASDSFQVALQFEARSVAAMTGLGQVHVLLGRLEDARAVVMRALAIAPRDHDARRLMGEIHAKSGRFDLAVIEFRKAAEAADEARRRRPVLPG